MSAKGLTYEIEVSERPLIEISLSPLHQKDIRRAQYACTVCQNERGFAVPGSKSPKDPTQQSRDIVPSKSIGHFSHSLEAPSALSPKFAHKTQGTKQNTANMFLLYGILLFSHAVAATPLDSHHLRISRGVQVVSSTLICHITMECVSEGDEAGQISKQHHHYECSPVADGIVSDFSYSIDLPSAFVDGHQSELMAGTLFANVPKGEIVNSAIVYPFNSEITVAPAPDSFNTRHQRRLTAAIVTSRVLVLRISALDTTNTYSNSQLYNFIFDNSQPYTQPTLASQYGKLSFGKLNFVPTQYGVMEVQVPVNATGATSMTIRDAAISVVQTQYGVSSITDLADHVMLCIPPGTGNWAGSSPVQSWRVVLNDQWCGFLSGFMHEMGHNLGLLVSVSLRDAIFLNSVAKR